MENVSITSFTGKSFYLSNFFPAKVKIGNITFPSSEHAFHAEKTNDISIKRKISLLKSASESKRFGKSIKLIDNWNNIRISRMFYVVYEKFKQNAYLRDKLLATGYSYLEEGNTHGDRFWGTVDGKGTNYLGKILMVVREIFRLE